jgi:integrase
MPKCPHLHRRRNTLYFRLSVPIRLQSVLRVRELTQTLHTQNYKEAVPAAYKLAGEAKTLFNYLDSVMSDKGYTDYSDDFLREVVEAIENKEVEAAKNKNSLMVKRRQEHARSQVQIIRQHMEIERLRDEALEESRAHKKELVRAVETRELEMLRKIHSQPIITQQEPIVAKKQTNAPKLSDVFEKYVQQYQGDGSKDGAANKVKIKSFGRLFINYVGEGTKINELTQKMVNDFFRLLVRYPGGRGGKAAAFEKLTFLERIEYAEKNSTPLISPKAFDSSYKSPANLFFKYLRVNYEDHAPALVIDHLKYADYGGKRSVGEDKQRALNDVEVEKLMNSAVMAEYAEDAKQAHKYWLPMIGLFTGARVNEICQLNPQYDIVEDEKTGVWYFNLTEETPGGDGVDKSHKNESSKRKVPIHSKLIELGLLDYCERAKKAGHDRIFNGWKPKQGKASYYAEEFFRDYLKDINLRDDKTVKKKVLGMHCLRSTFASHYVLRRVKEGVTRNQAMSEIRPIIGHADGVTDEDGKDLSITAGYIDKDILKEVLENLVDLRSIVEVLDYGISFPKFK